MNKQMQKALDKDGKKLRDITGEDQGPFCLSEKSPAKEMVGPPVVDAAGWSGTDRWCGFRCNRSDHRCQHSGCLDARRCIEAVIQEA